MARFFIFLAAISIFATGCLHTRLANHTRYHVQTVVDIQQQQVLDNVARFACNDKSTPFFSVPGTGTTTVGENNTGNAGLTWNPNTLTGETLGLTKQHTNSENWSLTPINAPGRLQGMRAAYQFTTGSAVSKNDAEIFESWFPNEENALVNRVPSSGWYFVAAKGKVPKEACGVGRFGDCYVWVDNCGLESLNRLTMAILELATREVPQTRTQSVVREWIPHFKDESHRIVDHYVLKSVKTTASEKNGKSRAAAPKPPLPSEIPNRTEQANSREQDLIFEEFLKLKGNNGFQEDTIESQKFYDRIKALKNKVVPETKKISPLPQYRDFSNPLSSQIFSGQR